MKLLPNLTTRVFASSLNGTSFQSTDCRAHTHLNDPVCRAAQSKSGTYMSYASGCGGFITFLVTPMVGTLSDIYGRTKFLALGTFFSLLPFCLLMLVYINPTSSLTTLYFYYGTSVLGGGVSNFGLAVGLMYLADMFKPENRAVIFALFLAMVELVLAGAPILGVTMYEKNTLLPWLCVSMCSVLTLATAGCCIPEAARYAVSSGDRRASRKSVTIGAAARTLVDVVVEEEAASTSLLSSSSSSSPRLAPWSPGSRTKVDRAKEDVENCRKCRSCAFNPLRGLAVLNRSNFFRFLAAVSFFQSFVYNGMNVISTYVQLYVLQMNLIQVSNVNAIIALTGVVTQVFLVQPLIRCIGLRKLMHVGNFSFFFGQIINLFVVWSITTGSCVTPSGGKSSSGSSSGSMRMTSGINPTMTTMSADACEGRRGSVWTPFMAHDTAIMIYIVSNAVTTSLAMLTFPAISALKANEVSMSEQGSTLGALWSTRALAGSAAPFLFGWMWHQFRGGRVWLIYVVACSVAMMAFLFGFGVPKPRCNEYSGVREEVAVVEESISVGRNGSRNGMLLSDPLLHGGAKV